MSVVTEPTPIGSDRLYDGATTAALAPGDEVTVSGDGATVPAFTVSATAPPFVDDTYPWPGILSRTEDATFTWPAADVVVVVIAHYPPTEEFVYCTWSGMASTTLEAAVIAGFAEAETVSVGVDVINEQRVVAGDYVIELQVASQTSNNYEIAP